VATRGVLTVITRDELLEKGRVYDLNHADVQRDYVFGWLISGIFQATELGETAVLKGGNSLRKGYFPGTRFSDDLDFSTNHGLNAERVLVQLNEVCSWAASASGIRFDVDRNRLADDHQIDRDRHVYKFRLYFKDMLGTKDHVDISVRMDITEYDQLFLPAQSRELIHPYSDAGDCGTTIRCVKLEEALADKLKCLLQRRYCYDIFDIVYGAFISQDIEVNRTEMMQVFLRKTIFGASPLAAKQILLDLPVEVFRGYWSKVLVPAASRMSFDAAIGQLKDGLEELFAPLPAGNTATYAFYPSHLRSPIMEAASNRKLLKIRYHGATRLMEPYALTFKRRKSDGVGHEYFYAYDQTGGNSGPGIKTMFAHDVEALEVTDLDFTPRFEIQLAKAGDASQAGYFQGTRGRGSTPRIRQAGSGTRRRTSRRASTGLRYVVQCSYCGKQFTRTTNNTRMNKHKDPYGNQCYGRSGYFVRYAR
jgi:predicted nucleotidyltransferase component of viral defense system